MKVEDDFVNRGEGSFEQSVSEHEIVLRIHSISCWIILLEDIFGISFIRSRRFSEKEDKLLIPNNTYQSIQSLFQREITLLFGLSVRIP
jgi:hypothetical protein